MEELEPVSGLDGGVVGEDHFREKIGTWLGADTAFDKGSDGGSGLEKRGENDGFLVAFRQGAGQGEDLESKSEAFFESRIVGGVHGWWCGFFALERDRERSRKEENG